VHTTWKTQKFKLGSLYHNAIESYLLTYDYEVGSAGLFIVLFGLDDKVKQIIPKLCRKT